MLVPKIFNNYVDIELYEKDVEISQLESMLNSVKSTLDKYQKTNYNKVSLNFEFSNILKKRIQEKYNISTIFTNASLKYIELVTDHKLFDVVSKDDYIFDGASYPGGWIVAAELLKRLGLVTYKDFYASSYFSEEHKSLDKASGIYNENNLIYANNGDVQDVENLRYISTQMKDKKIMLYSSDLGMPVGNDYNRQEDINLKPHFGQTCLGLLVLKDGGNMVIKTYTFFRDVSKALIYILNSMFKEVYIDKPPSSKLDNSETYIICIGYKKNIEVVNCLVDILDSEPFPSMIMSLPDNYLYDIQKHFVDQQIKKIKMNEIAFDVYKQFKVNMFEKENEKKISEWNYLG